MRRSAGVAALALLCAGCPPPAPKPCDASTRGTVGLDPYYLVGGRAEIAVGFPVSSCAEPLTLEEVEVLDPDGRPVAASIESNPVAVTFVPLSPGLYHVTLRFEPNGGRLQADALVVADVGDAGTGRIPRLCSIMAVTDRGTALCNEFAYSPDGDGGVTTNHFPLVAAGDVVWMYRVNATALTRFEDRGGLTPTASVAFTELPQSVAASKTELYVKSATLGLSAFALDGGSLVLTGRRQLPEFDPSEPLYLLRGADALFAGGVGDGDGGPELKVCAYSPAALDGLGCKVVVSGPGGATAVQTTGTSEGSFWLGQLSPVSGGRLLTQLKTAGQSVNVGTQFDLPSDWTPASPPGQAYATGGPPIAAQRSEPSHFFTPRVLADRAVLERYPVPSGVPQGCATYTNGRLIWWSCAGETRYLVRGP